VGLGLVVAWQQSALAKAAMNDNHRPTRPPLLILIDAAFRIASPGLFPEY
jgi:hypothetical protein